MARKAASSSASPDPILLQGDTEDEAVSSSQVIRRTHRAARGGRGTSSSSGVRGVSTPRSAHKDISKGTGTPKARLDASSGAVASPVPQSKRSDGTPTVTPRGKRKREVEDESTGHGSETGSLKSSRTRSRPNGTPITTPTLVDKINGKSHSAPRSRRLFRAPAPAPATTPSRVSAKESIPINVDEDGDSEDDKEAESSPSPSIGPVRNSGGISRETFRANEALKRQREARGFVYEGDADAPRLTRSGRVVGKQSAAEAEDENTVAEEDIMDLDETTIPGVIDIEPLSLQADTAVGYEKLPRTEPLPPAVPPLLPRCRTHILNILSTLTGQSAPTSPSTGEYSEELKGLLNMLQGTVDRGEGNSALITGPRGSGKTRTVNVAVDLLSSSQTPAQAPIIVRLNGLSQTNDRLAIREMGRQIAEAEGRKADEGIGDEEGAEATDPDEDKVAEEYAPTTLPSHLLALLTASSPRSIIIILEEFDLFTEHPKQALLYCLLDVVQSINAGIGRGIAVIGVNTRIDTLLLLEKRVKSRFSHRQFKVSSPLSPLGPGWKPFLTGVLDPPRPKAQLQPRGRNTGAVAAAGREISEDEETEEKWLEDWGFAVEMLLDEPRVIRAIDRLTGLTVDVRMLFRPFTIPVSQVLAAQVDVMSVSDVVSSVMQQVELSGWGLQVTKLKGLPHPALGILVIAKHLYYAGREEFNFAQVEEEYLKFARTKLVGSGKTRWPIGIIRSAFDYLLSTSLLIPTSNSSVKPRFAKVRSTLSPHEIVGFFKGEGSGILGAELGGWGRMMGGHV